MLAFDVDVDDFKQTFDGIDQSGSAGSEVDRSAQSYEVTNRQLSWISVFEKVLLCDLSGGVQHK